MATETDNCILREDYRRPEGKPLSATEFAREVIEGPGGLNSFESREMVVFHEHERVHAAAWMIRCLANIDCPGSEEAVASILEKRRRDTLAKAERGTS